MMQNFAKYDARGRILFVGSVPASMVELQGDNVYVGDADPRRHWIDKGEVAERPDSPAVLAGSVLSQLPAPCTVWINGAAYLCTDTSAQLDFTYPGTYHVRVEAFPFLDATFTVTV